MRKTRIVEFPNHESYFRGVGSGVKFAIQPFFQWEILLWKNHNHFSGENYLGEKLLSDSSKRVTHSASQDFSP